MYVHTAISGEFLTYLIPLVFIGGWVTALTVIGYLSAAASLAQGVKAGIEGDWAKFGTGVGGAVLGGVGSYLGPALNAGMEGLSAGAGAAGGAATSGATEGATAATGAIADAATGAAGAASGTTGEFAGMTGQLAQGAGEISNFNQLASGLDPVGALASGLDEAAPNFAAFNPARIASADPAGLSSATGQAANEVASFPSAGFDDMAGSVSGVPDVAQMTPEQAGGLGGAGGGSETAEALKAGSSKLGAEIGGSEGMKVGGQAGQEILQQGGTPQQAASQAKMIGDNAGRIKTAAELGPQVGDAYGMSTTGGQSFSLDAATQNQPDLLGGTGPGGMLEPGMFDSQGMLGSENIGKFLDGARGVNNLMGVAGKSLDLAQGPPPPQLPPIQPMARRPAPPLPIPGGPMMNLRPMGGVRPLPLTGF